MFFKYALKSINFLEKINLSKSSVVLILSLSILNFLLISNESLLLELNSISFISLRLIKPLDIKFKSSPSNF